jgi:modulator of FtsH protease HflK
MRRNIIRIFIPILAAGYILSGIYTIDPDSCGIVARFGKIIANWIPPGLHYRLPFPIDQLYKVKTTTNYKMSVGFKLIDEIRNIKPKPEETQWLTGDTNIIDIKTMIQYTISEPSKFLFNSEDPQLILRRAAETNLTQLLGTLGVDDVLTTKKTWIQSELKLMTQKVINYDDLGILIVSVNLMSVDPPEEVLPAFQDVSDAKAGREKIINEAQGYANETIPKARGEAQSIILQAEGEKNSRISEAKGEAERFLKHLDEYRKAPELTKERLYLEFAGKVLPKMKKYITDNKKGKNHSTGLKFFQ